MMLNGSPVEIPIIDHRAGRDDDGYYIRTFTGKKLYWDRVEDHQYDIRDIAHALATRVRWTGHVREFFSIGQHSCMVHDMLPRPLRKQGLFHDAPEAYMPDFPSPLKWWLISKGVTILSELDKRVDRTISQQFNIPHPRDPLVKQADLVMLATENSGLMPKGEELTYMPEPLPGHLIPWTWQRSEAEFLARYNDILDYERAEAAAVH